MKHLEKYNRKKLGEILIDEGLISKTQLAEAERHRERTGEPLGFILVDCSYLPEEDLAKTVASQYQLPYVELTTVPANKDLEELIPMRDLVIQRLLPIEKFGSVVSIAAAEMPDMAVLKDLRQRTGLTPFIYVAMLSEIDRHIRVLMESRGLDLEASRQEHSKEIESALDSALGTDKSESEFSGDGGTITIEAPDIEEGEWQNLFDEANDEVLKELTD
jgi:type IV pilus assembly protein PilB